MTGTQVVVVKPGDVLLIGNTGVLDVEALDALARVIGELKGILDLKSVIAFDADIDLATVPGGEGA